MRTLSAIQLLASPQVMNKHSGETYNDERYDEDEGNNVARGSHTRRIVQKMRTSEPIAHSSRAARTGPDEPPTYT